MDLTRIGVDASVREVFPPERLRDELCDLGVEVVVVDGAREVEPGPESESTSSSEPLDTCQAVVTLAYHEPYLEAVDWVHSIQAGVDRFPFDAFKARGIALSNSTGIHGTAVGETVAGYFLMFARRLHDYVAAAERREWITLPWDGPFTLDGESACVVGLGTLGRGIAARATGLGMAVTGVRRSGEPVADVERVYTPDELHEAIAAPLFVAVAVPLTDETAGLIGAAELDAMRDEAYLVNVARGEVVDEDALVEAVENGDIAGAALDVFREEPLPDGSPLWALDDVIVTPHKASHHRGYLEGVADIVRENVRAIRDGAGDEEWTNRVV